MEIAIMEPESMMEGSPLPQSIQVTSVSSNFDVDKDKLKYGGAGVNTAGTIINARGNQRNADGLGEWNINLW